MVFLGVFLGGFFNAIPGFHTFVMYCYSLFIFIQRPRHLYFVLINIVGTIHVAVSWTLKFRHFLLLFWLLVVKKVTVSLCFRQTWTFAKKKGMMSQEKSIPTFIHPHLADMKTILQSKNFSVSHGHYTLNIYNFSARHLKFSARDICNFCARNLFN